MTSAFATRELLLELRQRQTGALAAGERLVSVSTIDLGWLLDLAEAGAATQEQANRGTACLDKIAGTSGRFDYLDELEREEETRIDMQARPEFWQELMANMFSGDEDEHVL